MGKERVGIIFVGVLLVIAIVGLSLQKNLRLKAFVESNSQAEVNWIAEDGLWFGGTYEDDDGDGKVVIDLPGDATLVTIGREFGGKPALTVISPEQGHLLKEDANADCPVVVANESIPLLNECMLSAVNMDESFGVGELEIEAGSNDKIIGFFVKDFSTLLASSSSVRSVSIELLDFELLETLPAYTGGGQILGYDSLKYELGFR